MQSNLRLQGIPTLTDDGHLQPKTPDQISSKADVIIGATMDSVRNTSKDKFSGQIKNVNLYNTLLDQSQIYQLYLQNIQSTTPALDNLIPTSDYIPVSDVVQTILQSHNGTNPALLGENLTIVDSINYTSISGTNSTNANTTSYPIVPVIKKIKSSIR